MNISDFHTHNLQADDAIISLPKAIVFGRETFTPRPDAHYSAGIHPWWAAEADETVLANLDAFLAHPQVVAVGECGFDALRSDTAANHRPTAANLSVQSALFEQHIALAEKHRLPVTIHCVRAFHLLLAAKKRLAPTTQWTVHGFRGNADLARQLLAAGIHLSFGKHFNPEALAVTPPECRHFETDEEF